MPGREQIDVALARYLYDQVGTWREVADLMRRADGNRFAHDAIPRAVRRADRAGVHPKPAIQQYAGAL